MKVRYIGGVTYGRYIVGNVYNAVMHDSDNNVYLKTDEDGENYWDSDGIFEEVIESEITKLEIQAILLNAVFKYGELSRYATSSELRYAHKKTVEALVDIMKEIGND